MATIHSAADGTIIRWLQSAALEAAYPDPPDGTANTITFDAEANRPTVRALNESTDAWRYDGTTLTNDGTPVAIAAASPDSRREIINRLQTLQAEIQAATTVNQLRATVQDMRRIVLALARVVTYPEE